jgi:hypothetical protein
VNALCLLPLGAAVLIGANSAGDPPTLTGLVLVVSLVTLGAIIEVVGHEVVGFRHTLRAVGRQNPGQWHRDRTADARPVQWRDAQPRRSVAAASRPRCRQVFEPAER